MGCEGRCEKRHKAVRVCDGSTRLTVAGTKRRKAAWNGRFVAENAATLARYRAEWRPPVLVWLLSGKRRVVADCRGGAETFQPALRAGYRQCAPLGVTRWRRRRRRR